MGDDELSTNAHNQYRPILEVGMDNQQAALKQVNEANRPPPPPPPRPPKRRGFLKRIFG